MDYVVNNNGEQILIEKPSKKLSDDIVDQLVACRKKRKMTQQSIADATGIKRANIARIETKRNEASLDTLIKYADSVGLKLSIVLEEA